MTLQERIDIYEKEMETLQFENFTNIDALEVGKIMVNKIVQGNLRLAVDINIGGQTIFRYAHTNTTITMENWLRRKMKTVLFAGESSILFGCKLKRDGKELKDVVAPNSPEEYVQCGGSFPIIIKNQGIIGTFSSSGLVDTEDHQILVDSISEYLNKL
ncbi:MAG: heme-binding protein [Clostridia bacterium]